MIVPTQRAVALVLAGAPLALVLGVMRPDGWLLALLWVFAILVLTVLDGALAPRLREADLAVSPPGSVEVGDRVVESDPLRLGRTRLQVRLVDEREPAE